MIDRVVILALAGSTVLGALLLLEWNTGQPAAHSPAAPAPKAEERMPLRIQGPRIDELVATTLEPKTDPNIVRSAQPQPQAQPQPLPQAMRAASTTGQPIGVATRPPLPLPAAAPPRPLPLPSARPPGPVRAPNSPRPPQ